MNLWFTLLYQPLINLIILFYKIFCANLGLAIIGLTILIRIILLPLTAPSLKTAQKLKEIAPELEKLKKKYKKDKQALAQAQMEIYRQKGINPAAGCLPQIIQIIVLIALFQVFNQVLSQDGNMIGKINEILYSFLKLKENESIRTGFFYLNLNKPDLIKLPFKIFNIEQIPGFFLIAAAVTQFLSSKIMMPVVKAVETKADKTPEPQDDFGAAMQTQMLYLMPIMTLIVGFKFPSGLVLYWLTFSLFMLFQQLFINSKNGKKRQN